MDNQTLNNTAETSSGGAVNISIILIDIVILVLSLSGNSLVIYTISKERKLQTTCNYLLLNLAICDVVVVSLGTSIDILLQFTNWKWVLGLVMCRTISPAMTMFYISASLILVVISLDRYKMFVHPLKARYQRKHVKYAVFVVHLISFTCVIPFAVFSTITNGQCYDVWPAIWYRKGYTVFLFIMQYALPLLIMAIAYSGVALSLMRNKSVFKKNFNIQRSQTTESTTSMKSLDVSSHRNNNVNLSVEQMSSRPQPSNQSEEPPQESSSDQLGALENEGKRGRCVACRQSNGNQRNTKIKNDDSKKVKNQQSCDTKSNKKANGTTLHLFAGEKRSSRENDNLIIESSTESPKSCMRPIKRRQNPTNNNDNKHTCGTCKADSPSKRRFSNRFQSVPSFRRNAMRRRRSGISGGNAVSPGNAKRDQRSNRALKMILLVVVVFAVFMLPMQIMSLLLDFAGKPTEEKYKIYAWFVMCSYFGSCTLNPFIYGLVDRTFRAGFKKFAKKVTGHCNCTANQSQRITNS